jgi:hypothetical protein
MFVSKNIVQTWMPEDVFGTFSQMKHSLLRRLCLILCAHVPKNSSRTRFVNNYFLLLQGFRNTRFVYLFFNLHLLTPIYLIICNVQCQNLIKL